MKAQILAKLDLSVKNYQMSILCFQSKNHNRFDEEIPQLLRQLVDSPKSIDLSSILCKDQAKLCTKKQLKQVYCSQQYTNEQVENYDYRNALNDFQASQNFKHVNLEENDEFQLKQEMGEDDEL